jgi:hypothetical protein
MVLAHPLTEPFQLPVSPLVSAWACTAAVLLVVFAWPRRASPSGAVSDRETASWNADLSTSRLVTRILAAALLILCIAAGRLGTSDELENLAPALIVGAAWPLLVLSSALAGPIWRWTDPWDTLARTGRGASADEPSAAVWPAALIALPWVWYLSAYENALEPRSVGAMLAAYSVFTVAGCLAFGRRRWLSSAEPLGILLSWIALLPRGRFPAWDPPRGAEALLGALAGGVLFGAARRSELWGDLNTIEHADLVAAAGALGAAGLGAALLLGIAAIARIESRAAAPAAARAAVPAVAAIIVAVAMDQNRLTTSIQLVPQLLGDPFGQGWDLFGRAASGLDPAPFGVRGLLLAQLAVLLAGHLAGAVVAARRLERTTRVPVALGLGLLVNLSVLAIATH